MATSRQAATHEFQVDVNGHHRLPWGHLAVPASILTTRQVTRTTKAKLG